MASLEAIHICNSLQASTQGKNCKRVCLCQRKTTEEKVRPHNNRSYEKQKLQQLIIHTIYLFQLKR